MEIDYVTNTIKIPTDLSSMAGNKLEIKIDKTANVVTYKEPGGAATNGMSYYMLDYIFYGYVREFDLNSDVKNFYNTHFQDFVYWLGEFRRILNDSRKDPDGKADAPLKTKTTMGTEMKIYDIKITGPDRYDPYVSANGATFRNMLDTLNFLRYLPVATGSTVDFETAKEMYFLINTTTMDDYEGIFNLYNDVISPLNKALQNFKTSLMTPDTINLEDFNAGIDDLFVEINSVKDQGYSDRYSTIFNIIDDTQTQSDNFASAVNSFITVLNNTNDNDEYYDYLKFENSDIDKSLEIPKDMDDYENVDDEGIIEKIKNGTIQNAPIFAEIYKNREDIIKSANISDLVNRLYMSTRNKSIDNISNTQINNLSGAKIYVDKDGHPRARFLTDAEKNEINQEMIDRQNKYYNRLADPGLNNYYHYIKDYKPPKMYEGGNIKTIENEINIIHDSYKSSIANNPVDIVDISSIIEKNNFLVTMMGELLLWQFTVNANATQKAELTNYYNEHIKDFKKEINTLFDETGYPVINADAQAALTKILSKVATTRDDLDVLYEKIGLSELPNVKNDDTFDIMQDSNVLFSYIYKYGTDNIAIAIENYIKTMDKETKITSTKNFKKLYDDISAYYESVSNTYNKIESYISQIHTSIDSVEKIKKKLSTSIEFIINVLTTTQKNLLLNNTYIKQYFEKNDELVKLEKNRKYTIDDHIDNNGKIYLENKKKYDDIIAKPLFVDIDTDAVGGDGDDKIREYMDKYNGNNEKIYDYLKEYRLKIKKIDDINKKYITHRSRTIDLNNYKILINDDLYLFYKSEYKNTLATNKYYDEFKNLQYDVLKNKYGTGAKVKEILLHDMTDYLDLKYVYECYNKLSNGVIVYDIEKYINDVDNYKYVLKNYNSLIKTNYITELADKIYKHRKNYRKLCIEYFVGGGVLKETRKTKNEFVDGIDLMTQDKIKRKLRQGKVYYKYYVNRMKLRILDVANMIYSDIENLNLENKVISKNLYENIVNNMYVYQFREIKNMINNADYILPNVGGNYPINQDVDFSFNNNDNILAMTSLPVRQTGKIYDPAYLDNNIIESFVHYSFFNEKQKSIIRKLNQKDTSMTDYKKIVSELYDDYIVQVQPLGEYINILLNCVSRGKKIKILLETNINIQFHYDAQKIFEYEPISTIPRPASLIAAPSGDFIGGVFDLSTQLVDTNTINSLNARRRINFTFYQVYGVGREIHIMKPYKLPKNGQDLDFDQVYRFGLKDMPLGKTDNVEILIKHDKDNDMDNKDFDNINKLLKTHDTSINILKNMTDYLQYLKDNTMISGDDTGITDDERKNRITVKNNCLHILKILLEIKKDLEFSATYHINNIFRDVPYKFFTKTEIFLKNLDIITDSKRLILTNNILKFAFQYIFSTMKYVTLVFLTSNFAMSVYRLIRNSEIDGENAVNLDSIKNSMDLLMNNAKIVEPTDPIDEYDNMLPPNYFQDVDYKCYSNATTNSSKDFLLLYLGKNDLKKPIDDFTTTYDAFISSVINLRKNFPNINKILADTNNDYGKQIAEQIQNYVDTEITRVDNFTLDETIREHNLRFGDRIGLYNDYNSGAVVGFPRSQLESIIYPNILYYNTQISNSPTMISKDYPLIDDRINDKPIGKIVQQFNYYEANGKTLDNLKKFVRLYLENFMLTIYKNFIDILLNGTGFESTTQIRFNSAGIDTNFKDLLIASQKIEHNSLYEIFRDSILKKTMDELGVTKFAELENMVKNKYFPPPAGTLINLANNSPGNIMYVKTDDLDKHKTIILDICDYVAESNKNNKTIIDIKEDHKSLQTIGELNYMVKMYINDAYKDLEYKNNYAKKIYAVTKHVITSNKFRNYPILKSQTVSTFLKNAALNYVDITKTIQNILIDILTNNNTNNVTIQQSVNYIMFLLLTSKKINGKPFTVRKYKRLSFGLIEYYYDIIDKLLYCINSYDIKELKDVQVYMYIYHYISLNRCHKLFGWIVNNYIGDKRSEELYKKINNISHEPFLNKKIELSKTSGEVSIIFEEFQHIKKYLDEVSAVMSDRVQLHLRINDFLAPDNRNTIIKEKAIDRGIDPDIYKNFLDDDQTSPEYFTRKQNNGLIFNNKGNLLKVNFDIVEELQKITGSTNKLDVYYYDTYVKKDSGIGFTRIFDPVQYPTTEVISNYMSIAPNITEQEGTLLMTYGYSGVGKTVSLFGKSDKNIKGMLQSVLENISVDNKIFFRCYEFYGVGFPYNFYWNNNMNGTNKCESNFNSILIHHNIDNKDPNMLKHSTAYKTSVLSDEYYILKYIYQSNDPTQNFTFDHGTDPHMNPISFYNSLDIDGKQVFVEIQKSQYFKFDKFITNYIDEDRRRGTNIAGIYNHTIYREKATANNPNSSRSIMVYEFQIESDIGGNKYYTPFIIYDLPGKEDINKTFLNSYVEINAPSGSNPQLETILSSAIMDPVSLGYYTENFDIIKNVISEISNFEEKNDVGDATTLKTPLPPNHIGPAIEERIVGEILNHWISPDIFEVFNVGGAPKTRIIPGSRYRITNLYGGVKPSTLVDLLNVIFLEIPVGGDNLMSQSLGDAFKNGYALANGYGFSGIIGYIFNNISTIGGNVFNDKQLFYDISFKQYMATIILMYLLKYNLIDVFIHIVYEILSRNNIRNETVNDKGEKRELPIGVRDVYSFYEAYYSNDNVVGLLQYLVKNIVDKPSGISKQYDKDSFNDFVNKNINRMQKYNSFDNERNNNEELEMAYGVTINKDLIDLTKDYNKNPARIDEINKFLSSLNKRYDEGGNIHIGHVNTDITGVEAYREILKYMKFQNIGLYNSNSIFRSGDENCVSSYNRDPPGLPPVPTEGTNLEIIDPYNKDDAHPDYINETNVPLINKYFNINENKISFYHLFYVLSNTKTDLKAEEQIKLLNNSMPFINVVDPASVKQDCRSLMK